MIKDRYFFSTGIPCHNGCLYCFAQFNNDALPLICYEKIAAIANSIIYPSCDGELYLNKRLVSFFDEYIEKASHYNIFSFSTKREFSLHELQYLKRTNEQLRLKHIGEIKISVSITNNSRIHELEPYASSYSNRLDLIQVLQDNGILTAVILKPILPFIAYEEYCDIINDCANRGVNSFVTGDLYVDSKSTFYNQYLNNFDDPEQCLISWLPHHPQWLKVKESSALKSKVVQYIQSKGLYHFNSDEEFLKDIEQCRG